MSSKRDFKLEAFPISDTAFGMRSTSDPSIELSLHLIAFADACRGIDEVVEATAGHQTVMIECSRDAIDRVRSLMSLIEVNEAPTSRAHTLLVSYDGEDLGWVAKTTGLHPDDIVRIHAGREYLVTMLGSPGFIYLSQVDEAITIPRLDLPRVKVPAGSVAIGGRQTGIYGRERPGGWRIIGSVEQVPTVAPGDFVRMVPR